MLYLYTNLSFQSNRRLEVLKAVHQRDPDVPVIMITAHGSIETAIEAMKQGAYDYVTKPFDIDQLRIKIYRAIRMKSLLKEVSYHRSEMSKTIERVQTGVRIEKRILKVLKGKTLH